MPVWREAHLEVKMYKTHHSLTTFASWDVEIVRAVVAKAYLEVKSVKICHAWTTFVEMSKK